MRKSSAIPGNTHIGCCGCLNAASERTLATHIVNVGGRSYALCEDHLDIDLPPKHNDTRKAT